jgi:hypothetical protein
MFALYWSMAFAALVSAEHITTTFWRPIEGTDKFGYYGSVIGNDNGHLTLALEYDNGTDLIALGYEDRQDRQAGIYTIAPTLFGNSASVTVYEASSSAVYGWELLCERSHTASDASATCADTMDPELASAVFCFEPSTSTAAEEYQPYSSVYVYYYGTGMWGSPGKETVTQVYSHNQRQSWCDSPSTATSKFVANTFVAPRERERIATFQVVITAGQEKMVATTGAGVSTDSIKPTGTEMVLSTGSAEGTSSGNAAGIAAPMKTGAPALAGLGALAAAFFL